MKTKYFFCKKKCLYLLNKKIAFYVFVYVMINMVLFLCQNSTCALKAIHFLVVIALYFCVSYNDYATFPMPKIVFVH